MNLTSFNEWREYQEEVAPSIEMDQGKGSLEDDVEALQGESGDETELQNPVKGAKLNGILKRWMTLWHKIVEKNPSILKRKDVRDYVIGTIASGFSGVLGSAGDMRVRQSNQQWWKGQQQQPQQMQPQVQNFQNTNNAGV